MDYDEFTDQELCKAVAKAMSFEQSQSQSYIFHDRNGICYVVHKDWTPRCPHVRFLPASNASAFELVKREIEQRGWGWASRYVPSKKAFRFEVCVLPCKRGMNNRFKKTTVTEHRAGCIAFLNAVEMATLTNEKQP